MVLWTVLTLSDLKRVGDLKRNVENMSPRPSQLETSHVALLVSNPAVPLGFGFPIPEGSGSSRPQGPPPPLTL